MPLTTKRKDQTKTMKTLTIFLLGLSLAAQTISVAAAEDYDVVILNGRVMDPETQFDGIRNVGIKDGKIATITKKKITGAETIDATGYNRRSVWRSQSSCTRRLYVM